MKKSFYFNKLKSCSKYYKVEFKSVHCRWMLWYNKYASSEMFNINKYVGDHTYGVEHMMDNNINASLVLIATLLMDDYIASKQPSQKKILRLIFRDAKQDIGGVIRPVYWHSGGTPEHRYSCLLTFSYMVK